jgi:hypothetical protein
MALTPENEIDFDLDVLDSDPELEPLKTYRIDYEKGEITNEMIEGKEAVLQFVHMALRTPRFAHAIYSEDYGSEIESLLADKEVTVEFKLSELPRMIEEALVYDERISDVTDIDIEHRGDAFHVSFTVHSDEGILLEVEEVFG